MKTDVLVAFPWFDTIPDRERILDLFRDAGYSVAVHPTQGYLGEDELVPLLPGVRACIFDNHSVTRRALSAANELRVISRPGSGVDAFDLRACTERGIVVTDGAGIGALTIAEFALGQIFALARRIVLADRIVRSGSWDRTRGGFSPIGKTAGVIGFGRIGRELGRLAAAVGMEVAYANRNGPVPGLAYPARWMPLEDVLRCADFVSIHLRLNPSTRHFIGAAELALMKPSAFLINTARGKIVDEAALARALEAGGIAGAALDVFEEEPLGAASPLLGFEDRVILSPHVAGTSWDGLSSMFRKAARNVLDVFGGRRPESVLNPDVFEVLGHAGK